MIFVCFWLCTAFANLTPKALQKNAIVEVSARPISAVLRACELNPRFGRYGLEAAESEDPRIQEFVLRFLCMTKLFKCSETVGVAVCEAPNARCKA